MVSPKVNHRIEQSQTKGTVMTNDRDINSPTIDIHEDEHGNVVAAAVIEYPISRSHLDRRNSIKSIADGEFLDVEQRLKSTLGGTGRAKNRQTDVAVMSFAGEEGYAVVRGTLSVRFIRCESTDPACDDVIAGVVDAVVAELRQRLHSELALHMEG
jgi:hypothetical protein